MLSIKWNWYYVYLFLNVDVGRKNIFCGFE